MAHKKGQGSSKNGRESHSKRLGVKVYGGEVAIAGNIIVRQRGTQFHPGEGVGLGKDHTIFAKRDGIVTFRTKKNNKKFISVLPFEAFQDTAVEEKPKAKKETKKEAPKAEAKAEKPAKKAAKTEGDDLTKIKGIGPAFVKRLATVGINTFDDLIALTEDKVAKMEEESGDSFTSWDKWSEWIAQAKELKG